MVLWKIKSLSKEFLIWYVKRFERKRRKFYFRKLILTASQLFILYSIHDDVLYNKREMLARNNVFLEIIF